MSKKILVAGDVCLDVVGVPIPNKTSDGRGENWRQTGEMRTHYLLGGVTLLVKFIRDAGLAEAQKQALKCVEKRIKDEKLGEKAARRLREDTIESVVRPGEDEVAGPRPVPPEEISGGNRQPLGADDFLKIAERLRRDEVVHSLLQLAEFPSTGKKGEKERTLRVENVRGFSGPTEGDPRLRFEAAKTTQPAELIVLDDTGNSFRNNAPHNPWPAAINASKGKAQPLILYKLHRPLPVTKKGKSKGDENSNPLWECVAKNHAQNRLVVVSVDDVRELGLSISAGLSWERTALEVVWHLLSDPQLHELKICPRLIIRLGESGAIYWRHRRAAVDTAGKPDWEKNPFQAWLVYDPQEIEGTFAARYDQIGGMVGMGSVFVAAVVQHLAAGDCDLSPLLGEADADADFEACIVDGIRAGLTACRRLLQVGFGNKRDQPKYPGEELFRPLEKDDARFPCRRIPIIPETLEPDRNYWRLLDDIFANHGEELQTAVKLVATGTKLKKPMMADTSENALEQASLELRSGCRLSQAPAAVFAIALRTYDRREMEHYRALYTLMHDYVRMREPERPLSVAVFGPPGAGKSFGVKKVAEAIGEHNLPRPIAELTFNLSQFQSPDALASAFHLVRDRVLEGKVPLVFFDEFDATLNEQKLGWLRYFLAPMQDGKFLDRGEAHPIGQAIFVFAGGTCATFQEFSDYQKTITTEFTVAKGPDFLSRLRGALDIPSLNFLIAREPRKTRGQPELVVAPGTFDPYAPVETFPCRSAILLRRALVLAFQLAKKAPTLKGGDGVLDIRPEVLRALLHLPEFTHGNRSFEALLDMSHLFGARRFTPALLPPAVNTVLHADPDQMNQLVGTGFPFSDKDREKLARAIHKVYLDGKPKNVDRRAKLDWDDPKFPDELRESNREQADDIALKLRAGRLWFRKVPTGSRPDLVQGGRLINASLAELARSEHDRWVAQKRRQGWTAGKDKSDSSKIPELKLHNCIFRWDELTPKQQKLDYKTIRAIPNLLAAIGCEIIETSNQTT